MVHRAACHHHRVLMVHIRQLYFLLGRRRIQSHVHLLYVFRQDGGVFSRRVFLCVLVIGRLYNSVSVRRIFLSFLFLLAHFKVCLFVILETVKNVKDSKDDSVVQFSVPAAHVGSVGLLDIVFYVAPYSG